MSTVGLWQHPDNGRWYVTWTERGRSHRATTGTDDRREAERVRAAFVLERDRPAEAKPDEVAVASLLTAYYDRHACRLPSADQAKYAIDHLSDFFGAATVASVNSKTHERYRDKCLMEGASNGTINRRRAVLRAALRFAVKSGDLTAAPFVPTEAEPPPRDTALTRKQVAKLLRAARHEHPHVAMFIRLAVYTGARRGAILQLTWKRVDLDAGTVDFRLPGENHARKRRAFTALPPRLVSALRRRQKWARTDHVIEYQGAAIASIRRAFGVVAKAAGLPKVTPHVLKHTAASWALRVASPWIVSGMTATSIRTLQRVYGKHMLADLQHAAAAVAHSDNTRKIRANVVASARLESVVGATGIEPVTPTMSRKGTHGKRRK